MRPVRGGPGGGSRSRDVVTQVEDKLKVALPREILEATRSSLRVLKIRNPIGCFGKYDNEVKRACALLDYEVRDYNDSKSSSSSCVDVPMERLAKAAFMKLKDFRDFHSKVENFRKNLRTNSKQSKTKRKLQADGKHNEDEGQRATSVTGKRSLVLRKSSIASLAIQLGAFVPNTSEVALRALKLFQEVVVFLEKSSKKGGVYGLRDIQSNQSSYEAACFYLIATSGRNKKDGNASIRRQWRSLKEQSNGDDNEELDLKTFIDITKVSTKFHAILDYVSELQNEIESQHSVDHNASASSKFKSASFDSSQKTLKSIKRLKIDNSFKHSKEILDDRNPRRTPDVDIRNVFQCDLNEKEDNSYQMSKKEQYRSNTIFDEWKLKVLEVAYEEGRQKILAEKDADLESREKEQMTFTTEDILGFVAQGILARNGFT